MKKFLIALMLACTSMLAFAEASFDQIESLIEQRQYSAAAQGLEGIIRNHPGSAKAFYAMAQAQAGLGNLEKARFALDKARGLDPELKFASKSNIESLQTAITPQVAKIEPVKESNNHWIVFGLVAGIFGLCLWSYTDTQRRKREKEELEAEAARQKARDELSKARESKPELKPSYSEKPPTPAAPPAPAAPAAAPSYGASDPRYAPSYSAPSQPSVVHVHHGSSNDGLVTGMVLGQMMSNNHHHETTRVIEREVVREVPAPSRDSSWDTPAPSRSSSWDDSSSSRSSSWDSGSSSSSSWDSGSSSSSSSDSSSSWD